MLIKGTEWKKRTNIKIKEKKEKKNYVAQKEYKRIRQKELFLYFVKWSDHSNIIFPEGLLCLLCIKTTFPVQANDLSKDWKLRWFHYLAA